MASNLLAGMPAPDFQLEDVYGKSVSLGQYAGRPLVLVFIRHLG